MNMNKIKASEIGRTTVITTVGVSLFLNYFEKHKSSPWLEYWEHIKEKKLSGGRPEDLINQEGPLLENFRKAVSGQLELTNCAELKTLQALKKQGFEELRTVLLSSDTLVGYVAGEILKKKLPKQGIDVAGHISVEGWDVMKADTFSNVGIDNIIQIIGAQIMEERALKEIGRLLKENNPSEVKKAITGRGEINRHLDIGLIEQIVTGLEGLPTKSDNRKKYLESPLLEAIGAQKGAVILNISGGYKSIIPFLTLMGQLYGAGLCYIYEDSDELISIPQFPVQYDWSLALKYLHFLNDPTTRLEAAERKGVLSELQGAGLVDTGEKKLTEIGRLFAHYGKHNLPWDNLVLGLFYEYLLLEHYYNDFQKKEEKPYIERSYKELGHDLEVDIYIRKMPDLEIFVEAKSFYQVFEAELFEKVKSNIHRRVKKWKELPEEGKAPNLKFILSIWRFETDELEDVLKALRHFKKEIEDAYSGVSFQADSTAFRLDMSVAFSSNSYSKFFSKKINLKEDILNS